MPSRVENPLSRWPTEGEDPAAGSPSYRPRTCVCELPTFARWSDSPTYATFVRYPRALPCFHWPIELPERWSQSWLRPTLLWCRQTPPKQPHRRDKIATFRDIWPVARVNVPSTLEPLVTSSMSRPNLHPAGSLSARESSSSRTGSCPLR